MSILIDRPTDNIDRALIFCRVASLFHPREIDHFTQGNVKFRLESDKGSRLTSLNSQLIINYSLWLKPQLLLTYNTCCVYTVPVIIK